RCCLSEAGRIPKREGTTRCTKSATEWAPFLALLVRLVVSSPFVQGVILLYPRSRRRLAIKAWPFALGWNPSNARRPFSPASSVPLAPLKLAYTGATSIPSDFEAI